MTTKSLQGWVVHKTWSGDTSARVKFFTRELGLIECLCKGGRNPKKHALLQAFYPLWLAVDERYERYFARSIESNDLGACVGARQDVKAAVGKGTRAKPILFLRLRRFFNRALAKQPDGLFGQTSGRKIAAVDRGAKSERVRHILGAIASRLKSRPPSSSPKPSVGPACASASTTSNMRSTTSSKAAGIAISFRAASWRACKKKSSA